MAAVAASQGQAATSSGTSMGRLYTATYAMRCTSLPGGRLARILGKASGKARVY